MIAPARRIAAIWHHPTHAAEIALGVVLIGAGSAAMIPDYEPGASYAFFAAMGGHNSWAAARLVIGALLVGLALHDIVTHMALRWTRIWRLASLSLAIAMFTSLSLGFLKTDALAAVGAYGSACIVVLWCLASTSAHKRG